MGLDFPGEMSGAECGRPDFSTGVGVMGIWSETSAVLAHGGCAGAASFAGPSTAAEREEIGDT